MLSIQISQSDAEIVRNFMRANLRWLRRKEGHRPGVLPLIDELERAMDNVAVEYIQEDHHADDAEQAVHAAG